MDEELLVQAGFLKISPGLFECPRCRSLPLSLRAPNAVATGRFHGASIDAHKKECTGRGLYLGFVVDALSKIVDDCPLVTYDSLESDSFKAILQVLVGDSLLEIFCSGVLGILRHTRGHSIDSSDSGTVDVLCTKRSYTGEVKQNIDFEQVAKLFEKWALEVGIDSSLSPRSSFFRYFQLICPSLYEIL